LSTRILRASDATLKSSLALKAERGLTALRAWAAACRQLVRSMSSLCALALSGLACVL